MTNTVQQGIDLMKSSAQATHEGGSWSGWCESFSVRFGGFPGGPGSAREALDLSLVLSTNPAQAPAGALHWWRDAANPSTGDGHIANALGRSVAAMASSAIEEQHIARWHPNVGTINVNTYSSIRPGMSYHGWSLDWCGLVMKGVTLVCKVNGDDSLWLMQAGAKRKHLTPAAWAKLYDQGVRFKVITKARLNQYAVA